MLAFDAMNAFLEAEQVDLSRIVHGEQKFAYERPVAPGDVLTATLTVASLRQIGGNDIIGTTSEITDADGALVCTTRPPSSTGAAERHDAGDASSRRPSPSPAPTWSRYADASGDHNPIHQDEQSARSVGLPGVIAHGMYTMALAARAVDDVVPGRRGRRASAASSPTRSSCPADGGVEVEVAGTVKAVEDGLATSRSTVTCERPEGARHAQGSRACLSRSRRPHHPAPRRPGGAVGHARPPRRSWSRP